MPLVALSCSNCAYSTQVPDCAAREQLHCPRCGKLLQPADNTPTRIRTWLEDIRNVETPISVPSIVQVPEKEVSDGHIIHSPEPVPFAKEIHSPEPEPVPFDAADQLLTSQPRPHMNWLPLVGAANILGGVIACIIVARKHASQIQEFMDFNTVIGIGTFVLGLVSCIEYCAKNPKVIQGVWQYLKPTLKDCEVQFPLFLVLCLSIALIVVFAIVFLPMLPVGFVGFLAGLAFLVTRCYSEAEIIFLKFLYAATLGSLVALLILHIASQG
jgi:hypothetical protein